MRKPPFLYTELEEIVYLFQGGGALGSFQVGVYHALEEGGYFPDWMVGISIGAINASIIAGNPPAKRIEKLYQFWDSITHSIELGWQHLEVAGNEDFFSMYNAGSAYYALLYGQPQFFKPACVNPWFIQSSKPTEISFYDTTPLRKTIQELIDFDYLNNGNTRLSLGVVNVRTGKLKFFDNRKEPLGIDHIMASSAFPPGFPAVKIGKSYYWDGGLYSNTPLICVVNDLPHKNRLCFLVDLFDSTGLLPNNLDAVLERAKDINYAGHLDTLLNYYDVQLLLQKKIAHCIKNLPDHIKEDPNIQELAKYGDDHNVHIAKIIYKAKLEELHSKDYEFSNISAKKHIAEGYLYTKKMLSDPKWWKDPDENFGTIVHNNPEDLDIVVGEGDFED